MLYLGGFELYSRWVPLINEIRELKKVRNIRNIKLGRS